MSNILKTKDRSDRSNRSGFTLVELLIVVSIIGILAVISVPVFFGQKKSAARSEAVNNLTTLRLILEQNMADRGCYCFNPGPDNQIGTADDVGCQDPVAAPGSLPAGTTLANQMTRLQNVQIWWPKFQPGVANELLYDYSVQCPAVPSTNRVPTPPAVIGPATNVAPFNNGRSFTAFARPKLGTILARTAAEQTNQTLWINDRNENNFR